MPGFSKRFRPQPGDYGSEYLLLTTGPQQTITAAGTIQLPMGAINDKDDIDRTHGHTGYVDEIEVASMVVAAGSSTIFLSIKKFEAATGSIRTLVTNFDLKTLAASKGDRLPFDSTATDGFRTMQKGDLLYAEVVCGGTVTTQPILVVTAFIALLK